MRRLPENTLILTAEPFLGFMPADLRSWLQDHHEDNDLATALAAVNNHVGLLGHELDEVDDNWLLYAFEAWWELEKELYDLVIGSMQQANIRGEAHYNMDQKGLHCLVMPFMERNGYKDGSGWWVQANRDNNAG